MIRGLRIWYGCYNGLSHRRGNDSVGFVWNVCKYNSSSHRRGNDSRDFVSHDFIFSVHPTGVGMIRGGERVDATWMGSSHRRGNDSRRRLGSCVVLNVHPTGVGMIRFLETLQCLFWCSSHRRGNDSERMQLGIKKPSFIPQAWE